MKDSDYNVNSRESVEVVRLRVDGASFTVNTLRDQQTARGLSLICPFPALEVEIPISFGGRTGDPVNRGTIHRIGVEDDPESGLPRLRLSVRANDSRATVVASPPHLPIATALTDLSLISGNIEMREDEEKTEKDQSLDFIRGARFVDDLEMIEPIEADGYADPAWVGCGELPLPGKIGNMAKTRRRRKLTGFAAWVAVLGIAVAGGYVLDKAGVIDLDSVRDHIAGFDMTPAIVREPAPLIDDLSLEDEIDLEEPREGMQEVRDEIGDREDPEILAEIGMSQTPDIDHERMTRAEPDPAVETVASVDVIAVGSEPVREPMAVEAPVASSNEISFILPTRWPAEYANAYRLRDPNGVVVDIPGGLVKKEGWLEIGKEYPMIKSVKAVQREIGARYVIFINGELPRFMTAPKTGGILLKLIRDNSEGSGATEQIAALEK